MCHNSDKFENVKIIAPAVLSKEDLIKKFHQVKFKLSKYKKGHNSDKMQARVIVLVQNTHLMMKNKT